MLVYAWILPFTSCLRAMVKVLTFFTFGNVFKMCELAIVRVKWKKFTAAIVMQCGESTLWQPRMFNKLPPFQQLSWNVPDKIAAPHGSSHYHCGTWLPFVPWRFLRCIVPSIWRADSTSLLWAVTLYLLIMLCAVKGCFHHIASQLDLGHIPANLLREICPNTCVEPGLQPLIGEAF